MCEKWFKNIVAIQRVMFGGDIAISINYDVARSVRDCDRFQSGFLINRFSINRTVREYALKYFKISNFVT